MKTTYERGIERGKTEARQEVEPLMKTTYERGRTEALQEVEPLMKTTYERGIEQGLERGVEEGERRSALRLMEAKFGPLTPQVQQQVEALSAAALAQLQLDLLTAQALEELRLQD